MRRAIARARLPPGRTAAASPEVLAQMARRLMCRAWPRPQQCTPGSPSGAAVRHHGVAWRRACRLAQYKCSAQALSTGAQHGLGTGAHRQACPLPPARSRRAPHTLAHGAQADDDDSYVRPYPNPTPMRRAGRRRRQLHQPHQPLRARREQRAVQVALALGVADAAAHRRRPGRAPRRQGVLPPVRPRQP